MSIEKISLIIASIVAIIFLILVIIEIATQGKAGKKIDNSKVMQHKGFRKVIAAALNFLTNTVKKK